VTEFAMSERSVVPCGVNFVLAAFRRLSDKLGQLSVVSGTGTIAEKATTLDQE